MQYITLLHYRDISTTNMVGLLGDARYCDPRSLPYVKTDVTNARAKLRRGLSERDLELTIEYFERRQVENPNFFFSKLQEDGAVRALFWVDGRTRALYPKYKDCVFLTPHSAQIATTCPLLRLLALTTTHILFAWGALCCLMRPSKLSSGSSSNGCWQ